MSHDYDHDKARAERDARRDVAWLAPLAVTKAQNPGTREDSDVPAWQRPLAVNREPRVGFAPSPGFPTSPAPPQMPEVPNGGTALWNPATVPAARAALASVPPGYIEASRAAINHARAAQGLARLDHDRNVAERERAIQAARRPLTVNVGQARQDAAGHEYRSDPPTGQLNTGDRE